MPIQTQSARTFLDVTGGGWFRKRTYGVNIQIERLRQLAQHRQGRRGEYTVRVIVRFDP
jgi:hypothetical protein